MNVRFATILAWQGTVHIKAITVIPVNLVSDKGGPPAAKFCPPPPRPRQYPHPYLRVRDSRRYGCGFPPLPWGFKWIVGLYYGSVFTTWADSTLSCSTSLTLILGPKNNVIIK